MAGILESKHIVAVDDNFATLSLERNILRDAGADVHAINEARVAWAYLDAPTKPVDALVLDIVLGHSNGLEYLNRMLQRGQWIPTVIASGSQASRQMNALFEQGYSPESNHLPIALLKKRPRDFGKNMVSRIIGVIESGKSYESHRVVEKLDLVWNAAQDEGVYTICSDAVERYFSAAAYCTLRLNDMMESQSPEFRERANKLMRSLDNDISFSEFIGTPILALHKATTEVTQIIFGLNQLKHLSGPHIIWQMDYLINSMTELGNYYAFLRKEEQIDKTRRSQEDSNVLSGQMPAAKMHQIASGRDIHIKTPFDGYTPCNPNPIKKILFAHEMASAFYFGEREKNGIQEVAAHFEQAINALSLNANPYGNNIDILVVHPCLCKDSKEMDWFSNYRREGHRTQEASNFPAVLTEEGAKYLADAKVYFNKEYPNFEGDWNNHGEILAAIAKAMHPSMRVVGFSAWDARELSELSVFRIYPKLPYDAFVHLPCDWEKTMETIFGKA